METEGKHPETSPMAKFMNKIGIIYVATVISPVVITHIALGMVSCQRAFHLF